MEEYYLSDTVNAIKRYEKLVFFESSKQTYSLVGIYGQSLKSCTYFEKVKKSRKKSKIHEKSHEKNQKGQKKVKKSRKKVKKSKCHRRNQKRLVHLF